MHLRTSSTCWENAYFTFRFPIYLLTIKATTKKKHGAKRRQREVNENWLFYLFYENFNLTYSAEPRIACFHVAQRSSIPFSTCSPMRTCLSNKRITSGSRDWQEPSSILRPLLWLLKAKHKIQITKEYKLQLWNDENTGNGKKLSENTYKRCVTRKLNGKKGTMAKNDLRTKKVMQRNLTEYE